MADTSSFNVRFKFSDDEGRENFEEFVNGLYNIAQVFFRMGQQAELIRSTLSEISYTKKNPEYADIDALFRKLEDQITFAKQLLIMSGTVPNEEYLNNLDVNDVPELLHQGAEYLSTALVEDSLRYLNYLVLLSQDGRMEVVKVPSDIIKFLSDEEGDTNKKEEDSKLLEELENYPMPSAVDA